jgi:hypothetical protein
LIIPSYKKVEENDSQKKSSTPVMNTCDESWDLRPFSHKEVLHRALMAKQSKSERRDFLHQCKISKKKKYTLKTKSKNEIDGMGKDGKK